MLRRVALAVSVACLLVTGCGKQGTDIVEQGAKPSVQKIQAGTWQGSKDGASITLSLSADGRFQAVFRGGDYRSVVKGKAALRDAKLMLTATDFEGRAPQTPQEKKPIEFNLSEGWNTLASVEGITLNRKI